MSVNDDFMHSNAPGTNATFECACVQMTSGSDPGTNLTQVRDWFGSAAVSAADLVALPEAVDLLDPDPERVRAYAVPLSKHHFLLGIQELARECRKWVLVGSVTARSVQGDVVNRCVVVAPDGGIVVTYDKIHLFDAPVSGDNEAPESAVYGRGHVAQVMTLPWARLGLSICYDLRFPLLFRSLVRHGAEVLSVPSAFLRSTGEAHWHALLRARAIESGCYVIAPNQCGTPPDGQPRYGHSLIVDPWGRVLADAGAVPGVVSARLTLEVLRQCREALPCLQHERSFATEVKPAGT